MSSPATAIGSRSARSPPGAATSPCWPRRRPRCRSSSSGSPARPDGPSSRSGSTTTWPAGTPRPHIFAGPSSTVELAELDADVILNAVAGAQGLRATLASLQAGRTVALANKESLVAGGCLVTRAATPGQLVALDSEHSALAQVPARRDRGRGAAAGPHRQRRPVPRPQPRRTGRRDAGAGPGPSDLEHGPARHHQLGHPGEQGARGDRGAPAVRRALRAHRGDGAPAVGRALDGRVRRRLDARPGLAAGHAAADLAGPRLAATGSPTPPRASTGRSRTPGPSTRSTPRRSRPSAWPGWPARPPGAPRRCSTRPTRSSWPRFTGETSDSSPLLTRSAKYWTNGYKTGTRRRASRSRSRTSRPPTRGPGPRVQLRIGAI